MIEEYKLKENEQIKLELASFRVRCLIDPLSLKIPTSRDYVIEKKMKNGCWKRIHGIQKFSFVVDATKDIPECTLQYLDGITNLTEDDSPELEDVQPPSDWNI